MKHGLIAIAILFTASCSVTPETPEQKVFAATSGYGVALTVANAYKALPVCGEANAPVLCADKQVITHVQTVDKVTYEALSSAQKVVRASDASDSAKQVAATWAKEAVAAFKKVVDILKVK